MASPQLAGIINITPDSFSDGGKYFAPDAALNAIQRLIDEGADVIDIGAESTRPGAAPLTPDEEMARLQPVLHALHAFIPRARISIDTRHAPVAREALRAGAHWINDVAGFANPAMVEAVKHSDCKLVVMHSLTVPADSRVTLPENTDVIGMLLEWAQERFAALETAGIARERFIFDPGIGFGKTAAQSWAIVRGAKRLKTLSVPLLIGHSRKSFLATGSAGRDAATLAVSRQLADQGVDYLRVHDIATHRAILT